MDNPKDPNSSNNLNPNPTTPSFGAPPFAPPPSSPTPTWPATPSSPPSPPPVNSPLDNPFGATAQSPAIGPQQSQPTWVPNPAPPNPPVSLPEQTPLPSGIEPVPVPSGTEPAPIQSEQAPTDLSHLITNNPVPTSETLVMPSQASGPIPDVPTIPSENHKGIPKWLIGVGASLLIIVIGASAYFILGIGQPKQTTTSVPAEVSKQTVKAPLPIATPVPQPTAPAATESANFGQLQGSQTKQATSAADLLKQRQQQIVN